MKALVIKGIDDYGLYDVDKPSIGEDEVLIKTRASGICHSDYELIEGKYIIPFSYPIIPGHEYAGDVVEVGSSVKNIKVGDRVVGECAIGCDICVVCQGGQSAFCPNSNHFGFTQNGSDAEYFKAKAEWLHVLPDEIDYKAASLVEPFSCAYKGIYESGGLDAGDSCVIFGGGTIGSCAIAASNKMGAFTILIEPVDYKRDIGIKLGADIAVDPFSEDVEAVINEYTDGFGADLVVECSGNDQAYASTFDVVKSGGKISFIGINIGQKISVELGKIQSKGVTAKGSIGSPNVWKRCIDFIARTGLDLSPIQTHTFPLEEAVEAFKFNQDPSNKTLKITLLNE